MAFLVNTHFTSLHAYYVYLSLSFVFLFYLFFLYLSWYFCLLHFPHLIVYDTDTLKVKYFVWNIFELNWNSYPPIFLSASLCLSSFILSMWRYWHQINTPNHVVLWWQSIVAFLGTCDGQPMQCECGGFWSNGALLERLVQPLTPSCQLVIIIILSYQDFQKIMLLDFWFG